MKDLKDRTVRGDLVTISALALKFVLRTGSLVVLARFLTPNNFGLVGMVTAVTGVLSIFKDAGLSTVTVQRLTITNKQISTLFWINMSVGAVLFGLCVDSSKKRISGSLSNARVTLIRCFILVENVPCCGRVRSGSARRRRWRVGALPLKRVLDPSP
jgi:hypothetical protein